MSTSDQKHPLRPRSIPAVDVALVSELLLWTQDRRWRKPLTDQRRTDEYPYLPPEIYKIGKKIENKDGKEQLYDHGVYESSDGLFKQSIITNSEVSPTIMWCDGVSLHLKWCFIPLDSPDTKSVFEYKWNTIPKDVADPKSLETVRQTMTTQLMKDIEAAAKSFGLNTEEYCKRCIRLSSFRVEDVSQLLYHPSSKPTDWSEIASRPHRLEVRRVRVLASRSDDTHSVISS